MKLLLQCPKCSFELGLKKPATISVELRDDGLYEFECSKGHKNIISLKNQRFEILFDFGVMALIDGYNREAIANFAAAIERFYEFYIKVICLKHDVPYKKITKAWKPVSKYSERQLGAFLFLYLLDHKKEIDFLINDQKPKGQKEKWVELRNSVIHKGVIPTTEQVIAYGDLVYQYLFDLIDDLNANSAEWKRKIYALSNPASEQATSSSIIISLLNPNNIKDHRAKNLKEALKKIEFYKKFLYTS